MGLTMGLVQRVAVFPLQCYKYMISPLLPAACRFTPTCSDYACEAIAIHGIARGTWLAFRRVLRCNPLGSSFFDPVPPCHMNHSHSRSCHPHE